MNTGELLERLQRHYIKPGAPLPGGIFLPEVGWNGQSGGGCDAIYVGFTSTSGRILVGHELKVSRSDWLNELNKPGKADGWADQCHEWWLVVGDPTIVHDGELPAGWGLMAPGPSKTRMKVLAKPDRKPRGHAPSWDAVRSIMARQDTLRAQAIGDVRARAHEEARRSQQEYIDGEVARRMRAVPDAERLRDQVRRIEEVLGGPIDFCTDRTYRSPRSPIGIDELAAIAKICIEHRALSRAVADITDGYAVTNLRRSLDQLEQAIANLRAVPGQQMELAP